MEDYDFKPANELALELQLALTTPPILLLIWEPNRIRFLRNVLLTATLQQASSYYVMRYLVTLPEREGNWVVHGYLKSRQALMDQLRATYYLSYRY